MPDLESFLAEPRIVVLQLNPIPVRLDLMWNLLWRFAGEVHQRAQLWLFDAVGRLKLWASGRKLSWPAGTRAGNSRASSCCAPFHEIIDERYGVAADGFFFSGGSRPSVLRLACDRRHCPTCHTPFLGQTILCDAHGSFDREVSYIGQVQSC